MRIISQSGMIDLPYEQVVVSINAQDSNMIIAYPISDCVENDTYWTFAEYSTPEKAKKAMEMLRDKWISRMELEGGHDYMRGYYIPPNFWVLPRVFQFPQDEEIEV